MATREEIRHAADLIRSGKLVAFPTETVYGLGANALDAGAVRRIFEAKGRPRTSPLIVHVASAAMAREVAASWPEPAEKLASRYWPGPLTLVLPKKPAVPDEVTAGLPTVGIRVPEHPIALELIQMAGVPVAAPSANRFTQLSPTTAEHVRSGLGRKVDYILDGGPANVGIESTVLSLTGETPRLLRPGIISVENLKSLIGSIDIAGIAGPGAHESPGMHDRHYSPRTPLVIGQPGSARSAWVFWREEGGFPRTVRMPDDAIGYARSLYGVLHQLDTEGWDQIGIEPVPEAPEWAGIRDRLMRAAFEAEDRGFQEQHQSDS